MSFFVNVDLSFKKEAVFSPKRLINSQKRTHSIFKRKKKENIVFINNVLLVTTRKRSKSTRPSRGSIRVAVKSCCAQCPESRSDPSPRGARFFSGRTEAVSPGLGAPGIPRYEKSVFSWKSNKEKRQSGTPTREIFRRFSLGNSMAEV